MKYASVLLLAALLGQQEEGRKQFSSKENNFKLTYPNTWNQIKNPNPNIVLALMNAATDMFFVSAGESEAGVDDCADAAIKEQKLALDSVKEVSRKETTVAGERALEVREDISTKGLKGRVILTVFAHQGIVYRIIGVTTQGKVKAFEKDLRSIADSFSFLADREEWLKKFEGKPVRTALLGGLGTFELNRPRWTETTLDVKYDWDLLDQLNFRFMSGDMFVTLEAREAKGTAAAELDDLGHDLARRIGKSKVEAATFKDRGYVEIVGEYRTETYFYLATAIVEDGVTVRFWIEGNRSKRETVKRDWEQLLGTFQLQSRSKPDEPPAFPCRETRSTHRKRPALQAFLSQASRVVPGGTQLLAISPDGRQAIVTTDEGTFLETLETHKRAALTLKPAPASGVVWSADGKRVAYPSGESVAVAEIETQKVRTIAAPAAEVSFTAEDDSLLICTRREKTVKEYHYGASRLERVTSSGERKPLVEFPLSRVSNPVLSPDGKLIALVTNRDYPRSADEGGHLYVCAADGTDLRQLTKDPEGISSVAWAPNGKYLYVVRRIAVGENGAVGPGGSTDLWRISADTGTAVNLTRSDDIGMVWTAGPDILVEVKGWHLPDDQKGIFRIAPEELEAATATRPVPPVGDPKGHSKAIAAKVRATLGVEPKDFIPTPELMAKVSQAFAEAVRSIDGTELDFRADSLEDLDDLCRHLDLETGSDPALLIGLGACYGETLRRAFGAEWKIKTAPFGDWRPGIREAESPLAAAIFPFSGPCAVSLESESIYALRTAEDLQTREEGKKLILVYPPTYADDAVREATGPAWYEAHRLLDEGRVQPAVDILAREMRERPTNRALALEAISICQSAGMPDAAQRLLEGAIQAGNEVPELLIRYADGFVKDDPKKALEHYRKAVKAAWPPAEAFIKLGKAYKAIGRTDLAESCWRKAYRHAGDDSKPEIRQLMGMSHAEEE